MQYIGKLDRNKLGKYKDKIYTEHVILTSERIEHIRKRHPGDYERCIQYIPDIIENPDYILEDNEHENTILILKNIKANNDNIQVVIKLQTIMDKINRNNSILTFWHIRDRNYKSTIRNNKIIYENVDNDE